MNRFVLGALVIAALVFATVSCNKGTSPSDAASTAAEAAKTAAQAAPVTTNTLDPKTLLTDAKIGQFVIYQREISSAADLAMGVGVDAYKNSGGSQKGFEKELSKDARTQKIADVQKSALEKSGLTTSESVELTKLLTSYIVSFGMGTEEMKKKSRDEMTTKYGPDAVAAFEKHLPELSKIQDQILEKALGKKK